VVSSHCDVCYFHALKGQHICRWYVGFFMMSLVNGNDSVFAASDPMIRLLFNF
jgi:hypothetical protein